MEFQNEPKKPEYDESTVTQDPVATVEEGGRGIVILLTAVVLGAASVYIWFNLHQTPGTTPTDDASTRVIPEPRIPREETNIDGLYGAVGDMNAELESATTELDALKSLLGV